MPTIHPSAIIEPGAELADDVQVGPFCVVGPNVRIGAGSQLISHANVMGHTTMGKNNIVWPGAILGGKPQDLKYRGEDSELIIGDNNEFREYVTVHKGTANDNNVTRIGNHNLIMAYAHVGHDCIISDHSVIANAVQLAGHVLLEDHANLGGATAVHHFVTIGRYAFVSGASGVTFDVPPYMVVKGNPAFARKVNTTLLLRHNFSEKNLDNLKRAYRRVFGRSKSEGNGVGIGQSHQALEQLEAEYADDEHVNYLCQFLRRTAAGVHGRHRESLRRDNTFSNPVR